MIRGLSRSLASDACKDFLKTTEPSADLVRHISTRTASARSTTARRESVMDVHLRGLLLTAGLFAALVGYLAWLF
jgi:hypothetical protein